MSHPRKSSVKIPQSKLSADLAKAEAIKREMDKLLRELEEHARGRSVDQPGAWRHDPTGYLRDRQRDAGQGSTKPGTKRT